MRAFILFLIAAMAMVACNKPQNQFEISGDIQQVSGDWVILAKASDNELLPIDSMQVKDGRFNFKGTIDIPEMYYLHFKADEQYLGFFVEPGKLQISGTPEEPEYSGMPTQEKYDKLMEQMRVYELKFEELTREYREAMAGNDEAAKKEIEKRAETIEKEQIDMLMDYARANSSSVVAPYVLVNNISRIELDRIEAAMETIDPQIHESVYYEMLNEEVEKMQLTAIGRKAPLFEQNDPDGNPVALESFRGNYVLIDFWAAWCSPCRVENPNIVAAYEKYNDKGFEILGVSLDRDRNAWLKAIKDDNLTWTNVSDLNYWNNAASRLYNVSSIPASFLLDPDGIIIAKNLRGDALHDKLAEIYD
jgi:peroxiredoxin/glutaredoxin